VPYLHADIPLNSAHFGIGEAESFVHALGCDCGVTAMWLHSSSLEAVATLQSEHRDQTLGMGPRGLITVSLKLAVSRAFSLRRTHSRHLRAWAGSSTEVTRVRTLKPEAADSRVNPAWNLAPAVFVEIDSPRGIVAIALSSAAATRNRCGIQGLSQPVVVKVFCPIDSSTPDLFHWHLPTALLARLDESHRRRSRYLPSEFCCERTFCVSDALGICLFVGRVVGCVVDRVLALRLIVLDRGIALALRDGFRTGGWLI
jgi:hypothetical protein